MGGAKGGISVDPSKLSEGELDAHDPSLYALLSARTSDQNTIFLRQMSEPTPK
jgi:glutamate dehydrogenase/leucine dehydrogenase